MTLHCHRETDSLYIELSAGAAVETRAISDGIDIDLSADEALVGIDTNRASAKLDLSMLESNGWRLVELKAA